MALSDFFRKFRKNETILDLGNLQKKGFIRQKKLEQKNIDNRADDSSPLSFLGSLASVNESSQNQEETDFSNKPILQLTAEKKAKLKGILRDMKSKIDNTYDKVYKLSERLDLLEKKIERLERRINYSSR